MDLTSLGLEPWRIAAMFGAYVIGGFVKGGLGFGMPLVTMAIMPAFLPVDLALALNAVVLPTSNIVQIARAKATGETLRRFWPVILGIAAGVPVGALFVDAVDDKLLMAIIGGFVLAFTALSMVNARLDLPAGADRGAALFTGVLAGVVGALTTASGPIVVIYLVSARTERRLMLSALGVFFLVIGVLVVGSFFLIGILDLTRFLTALVCLIPASLGMWLGDRLMGRAKPEAFRKAVLIGLGVLSLNLILRGLGGI